MSSTYPSYQGSWKSCDRKSHLNRKPRPLRKTKAINWSFCWSPSFGTLTTSCGGSWSWLIKSGCFYAGDSQLIVENNFLETEGMRVCVKRPFLFERSSCLRAHCKHPLCRTSGSLVHSLIRHQLECKKSSSIRCRYCKYK